MESIIEVKNLKKYFNRTCALNGINIDIYKGEIFGILGPNGSGKTTLIKILLGLLFPSSGSALIMDKSPLDSVVKYSVGYLPEMPQYYPFLSPQEVLDFYASLFSLPKKTASRRSEELLDLTGLSENRKRPLGTFSKGMLQRVGLAVSLINDPQLLLLDEPTIGLDPIGAFEIRSLLLKLKSQGKTILISSHILSEIENSCDRIAILYKGRLIKIGLLTELLAKKDEIQVNVKSADKEAVLKLLSGSFPQVSLSYPRQSLEEVFWQAIKDNQNVL